MKALNDNPSVKAAWDDLNRGIVGPIDFRLLNLKTQVGREKHIQAFLDMLAKGDTPIAQKVKSETVKKAVDPDSIRRKKSCCASPTIFPLLPRDEPSPVGLSHIMREFKNARLTVLK